MESHARYEQLIDELILDEASAIAAPEKWQTLRAHLAECRRCRERYDRVALAERMLHGGPRALAEPSAASLERIGAAVMAQTTRQASAWQRMVQWFTRPGRVAAGLVTAAALAALFPLFVGRPRAPSATPGTGEFQSRGARGGDRRAGVRAFCLDANGVTPRCTQKSQLRLTVSNTDKLRYVFVFGLDEEHAIKWYAPRPPETMSVAAPPGNDVPLGDGVRLGVNHDPGPVRVYALFSNAPVSTAEVQSAVERLRAEKRAPSRATSLPLQRNDVVQDSVTFDVSP
jgi:hypothetical protein